MYLCVVTLLYFHPPRCFYTLSSTYFHARIWSFSSWIIIFIIVIYIFIFLVDMVCALHVLWYEVVCFRGVMGATKEYFRGFLDSKVLFEKPWFKSLIKVFYLGKKSCIYKLVIGDSLK